MSTIVSQSSRSLRSSSQIPTRFMTLFIIIAFLATVLIGSTYLFSAQRHPEADRIRNIYRSGQCNNGTEYHYSPKRGTFLILCHISDDETGGLIYRITENAGKAFVEHPYEVTIFGSTASYWAGILIRDGYVDAGQEMIDYFSSLGL